MSEANIWSRRDFVCRSASCAAHIGLMAAVTPRWVSASLTQERFPVVASEPWGRIERIADGIWALVSDPLADRTTLCNGGIIAGRTGVVVVEAFGSDEGAAWMMQQARRLTGRHPTHVALTHYHADHTGGMRGVVAEAPAEFLATPVTRDEARQNSNAANPLLNRATPLDTIRPTEVDLGDRSVLIVPRRGHTESDITIEVTDPSIVFCGDLVWNGMFPNYVDATPSRLTQAVRLIRASDATTYVPGHGPLADATALDRYVELLDHVEDASRRALDAGITAEQAGAEYTLPAGMEEWVLFNPAYFSRAIGAWMHELGATPREG